MIVITQRPIMVVFCRFGTLLRSITPPLLSPNSPHYGSKSNVRVYLRIVCVTFYFLFFDSFFFFVLTKSDNTNSGKYFSLFLFFSYVRLSAS